MLADGGFGPVAALPASINTRADERRPALRPDGRVLLFARNGKGGQGGFDLYRAEVAGTGFAEASALPAPLNSAADELGAEWLGNDGALALTRVADGHSQVWVVGCDHAQAAVPLGLSFNTAEGQTGAPVVDASKPGELVVAGQARSPKAGVGSLSDAGAGGGLPLIAMASVGRVASQSTAMDVDRCGWA